MPVRRSVPSRWTVQPQPAGTCPPLVLDVVRDESHAESLVLRDRGGRTWRWQRGEVAVLDWEPTDDRGADRSDP